MVSLGYSDRIRNSLMEGTEPNTYDLAKYASSFNQEALEVDVELMLSSMTTCQKLTYVKWSRNLN